MWLFNSSIGKKFIMALTGICLVLFVTFHVLMNAVAICWPSAYNSVCQALGANWYALICSAGLGLLVVIHIIYALVLTIQNRKARGNDRYAVSARPKSVEWSSQNMLVLGIVIVAFLGVHLVQFWARMQAQEVMGSLYEANGVEIPAAAGTLFLQIAFQNWWTPVIYMIGFVALWFHLNHGFWSMWQSIGINNNAWLPRWKKVSCWWVTAVCALFALQAVVFTVRANQNYYVENETLKSQYMEMYKEHLDKLNAPLFEQMQALQEEYQQLSKDSSTDFAAKMQRQSEIQAEFSELNSKMEFNAAFLHEQYMKLPLIAAKPQPAEPAAETTPAAVEESVEESVEEVADTVTVNE